MTARWRVEALFQSGMGQRAWVRFNGDFDSRAEAEIAMAHASKRTRHDLRVVEVK